MGATRVDAPPVREDRPCRVHDRILAAQVRFPDGRAGPNGLGNPLHPRRGTDDEAEAMTINGSAASRLVSSRPIPVWPPVHSAEPGQGTGQVESRHIVVGAP